MELNLSKDEVEMYRRWYAEAEPYTEEEIIAIPLDADYDRKRMNAHSAKVILEHFGIPLVADDD